MVLQVRVDVNIAESLLGTAAMMIAKIIGGTIYGSMAPVADGWHMSTHAGANGTIISPTR